MPAVPKSPTSLEAPKPVDTHNGGALIFAPFSVRGSPVAWAAGRNRRLVRAVTVGPFSGADRRRIGVGNRRSLRRFTHGDTRQFAPGRIITGHGMATYIQWRRIPDRSESTSESKCKVYHPRSQSPRTSPVLLSTMPRSLGIQIF